MGLFAYFRVSKKVLQNRKQKTTTKLEIDGQRQENESQNETKNRAPNHPQRPGGATFFNKFQFRFERFWDPKMAQLIIKNRRQLGASWRPPGPPGPLRRPPGSDFRAQNATKPRKIRRFTASSPKRNTVSEPPNHRKIRGLAAFSTLKEPQKHVNYMVS